MKACCIVVLCVSLGISAFAQDVRKVTWGMSVDQIMASESTKPAKREPMSIYYHDKVAGFDCAVQYLVSSKGLSGVGIHFIVEHTNKSDFITDYGKLKDLLSAKYGSSTSDRTIWKDDLYKSEPAEWGMAIAVGHLQYQTEFMTNRTRVLLVLYGDNYKIYFGVYYYSLEYWQSYIDETEAAQSEGL